jgi:hypothetical protein
LKNPPCYKKKWHIIFPIPRNLHRRRRRRYHLRPCWRIRKKKTKKSQQSLRATESTFFRIFCHIKRGWKNQKPQKKFAWNKKKKSEK